MRTSIQTRALMMGVAAMLAASPAVAQGKQKHHEKHKHAQSVARRDHDDRWEDGREDRADAARRKSVPPGWCKGRGNPHNTVENCGRGDRSNTRDRDRYDPDRRYDDARGSAYLRAHEGFHRTHDRQCREQLARRPFDPVWQVRVRSDCRAEHVRWHERAGSNHDGPRRR